MYVYLFLYKFITNQTFSNDQGLDPDLAKQILKRDGPNSITPPETTPEWVRFVKNMFGWFNMLLWIGAILCYTCYAIERMTLEYVNPDNVSSMAIDNFIRQ